MSGRAADMIREDMEVLDPLRRNEFCPGKVVDAILKWLMKEK